MKSVIIADDSPIILEGLSNLVSDMKIFDLIISVTSGIELLQKFREHSSDLLIIDIAMPKMSGFDIVKKIRLINDDVKILLISNFNGDEIKAKSLQLGATGFIDKMHFAIEIYYAIEKLQKNKSYFSKDIVEKAKTQNSDYLTGLEFQEIERKLSNREHQIFREIGADIEASEVATKLNISRKTVDNHVEKIKKKLNLKSKHSLYRIATIHSNIYGDKQIKSN